METVFAALACCLLLVPFAVAQAQEEGSPVTPTGPRPASDTPASAALPSANSTGHVGVISDSTESTTSFPATTPEGETSTGATAAAAATPESATRPQTSQSTVNGTIGTSPTTTTLGAPTSTAPTSTALTTTQTTGGYVSTTDATAESSSHAADATSESTGRTTRGLGLNISEKNMTIVFSAVLGAFALTLVVFMFHKCKHKIQYLHQPLNNAGDDFVADDDTLVISGGLYDGHPIYDNVPTAQEDPSQFRLQFFN
ncbi:hypothetical protein EYF80_013324 [Liparis tanakae]|uniref:Uncharacterized protein n=1 Tax=Liparis tanakae TaxID=230148 RepID=A0A4Z2IEC6_9TELE|nr:hypothetical protein EYF80_013324 [Liparis tanakae]